MEISIALVQVSLNNGLPVKIYLFALTHACVRILMQKNDKEAKRPIDFMSSPLKNAKLNYSNLNKPSFSLIKVVNKFFHYILRIKVYVIMLDPTIKSLLINWIRWKERKMDGNYSRASYRNSSHEIGEGKDYQEWKLITRSGMRRNLYLMVK